MAMPGVNVRIHEPSKPSLNRGGALGSSAKNEASWVGSRLRKRRQPQFVEARPCCVGPCVLAVVGKTSTTLGNVIDGNGARMGEGKTRPVAWRNAAQLHHCLITTRTTPEPPKRCSARCIRVVSADPVAFRNFVTSIKEPDKQEHDAQRVPPPASSIC